MPDSAFEQFLNDKRACGAAHRCAIDKLRAFLESKHPADTPWDTDDLVRQAITNNVARLKKLTGEDY